MLSSISLRTRQLADIRSHSSFFACSLIIASIVFAVPQASLAKSKTRHAPRPEPELKILELKVAPAPYRVADGPLEFSALVQLPKELNGATLLEVSSFVTSPSKTSIRFLSIRRPLEPQDVKVSGEGERPSLAIALTWDGMDHKKTPAGPGVYQYEFRAKLLTNGEKGPRTLMVSWPKRGTLEVR